MDRYSPLRADRTERKPWIEVRKVISSVSSYIPVPRTHIAGDGASEGLQHSEQRGHDAGTDRLSGHTAKDEA
jgi:hypothetical protein